MWRWCKRESRETVRSSTGDPPQTLATGSLDRLRLPVLSLGGRLWCMSALESSTLNTQQWVFPPWLFQNTGFITQGQVSSVVTRTENSFWWLICLPKAYHIISYHIISYASLSKLQKLRDSECREWRKWEQKIKCKDPPSCTPWLSWSSSEFSRAAFPTTPWLPRLLHHKLAAWAWTS